MVWNWKMKLLEKLRDLKTIKKDIKKLYQKALIICLEFLELWFA